MVRQVHAFDPPERFVAGTVGQPGERTFYLQAAGHGRLVSVQCEKAQVALLAERLAELLDELRRRGVTVPAAVAPDAEDVAPLQMPVDPEFRVGAMALAWDPAGERVIIQAQALAEEEPPAGADSTGADPAGSRPTELGLVDPDDPTAGTGPDVLLVRLDPPGARAFVERAARVVAAGRPPCPLCGLPLDAAGHVCPRLNGHGH
ncbi:MAG: DUF3090 family protein [Mycobacteriales bacterium]